MAGALALRRRAGVTEDLWALAKQHEPECGTQQGWKQQTVCITGQSGKGPQPMAVLVVPGWAEGPQVVPGHNQGTGPREALVQEGGLPDDQGPVLGIRREKQKWGHTNHVAVK